MANQRRRKLATAIVGVLGLAAATFGSYVLVRARVTFDPRSPSGWPIGWDFRPAYDACRAILTRTPLPANSQAYPLPYELLFMPLSFWSASFAQIGSAVLTAAFLVPGLMLWSDRHGWREPGFWIAILSVPAVEVVQGDHPFSTLGVLAVAAALRVERSRGWLAVGVASAISLIRPFNAAPVLVGLLRTAPLRGIARAAVGFAGFLVVFVGLSYLADRSWVSQYASISKAYGWAGLVQPLVLHFGISSLLLLEAAVTALGLVLARRDGEGMDLDRAAAILALTVFVTPLAGLYVGVFALPALVRLAERRGTRAVPWICSGLAWFAVLALIPSLLGPAPRLVLAELGALVYWFGLNSYPLFRRRPPEPVAS